MRIVDRPAFRPQHCAANVNIGQTKEGERWIDTGVEMPGFDNHVYLCETTVREAARVFGHPTPADYEAAIAERDELALELEALHRELAQLRDMKRIVDQIRKPPVKTKA